MPIEIKNLIITATVSKSLDNQANVVNDKLEVESVDLERLVDELLLKSKNKNER